MPAITGLESLRQEECHKFKAGLSYMARYIEGEGEIFSLSS